MDGGKWVNDISIFIASDDMWHVRVFIIHQHMFFPFANWQYDWVLAGFKSDNGGNAHQFGTTCRQRTELTYIGAILVVHNGS